MTTEALGTDTDTGFDPETEAKLDALHEADKANDGASEEIEIEVTGDDIQIVEREPGSGETKEPEAEAEPAEPKDDIQSALADLRSRLEAAEREKNASAARERDAIERAQAAAAETHRANLGLIDNALNARKQHAETLKARFREASIAQDHDALADIQFEMSSLTNEIARLEDGKRAYEKSPPQVQRTQAPSNADPVEQMAAQMEQTGSARSAQWIRNNPDYARDPKKFQKMLAAHNLAVADDLVPDTDAYFAAVEGTLGMKKTSTTPTPAPRAAPPPAAPTAASAPAGSGKTNPNRITLSRAEVEMAKELDMTPQEYARNKIALQKEGKLGK